MSVIETLPRPSLARMLIRGLLRRCPWCGDHRAYFTGWFTRQDACRACAMPWRRGDVGFELGAVTVTTILTFGAVIAVGAGGLILTAPQFAVLEITLAVVAIAVLMPVAIYPSSYTLWQACDLAMRPPAVGEWTPPPGA